jgi:hypothetical protein
MKRIDAIFNGEDFTFRTNNDGSFLFIGVSENRQISCESGFDSLARMKRAVKEHLRFKWDGMNDPMPRVKYTPHPTDTWKP